MSLSFKLHCLSIYQGSMSLKQISLKTVLVRYENSYLGGRGDLGASMNTSPERGSGAIFLHRGFRVHGDPPHL